MIHCYKFLKAYNERRILIADPTAAYEEVATSEEPTTSMSSMSRSSSHMSILSDIGPVHKAPPKPKSNRGRKPMKTSILTSAESIADLKLRKENRSKRGSTTKPPPKQAKRAKKQQTSSSSDEESENDADFCIICLKKLPTRLSRQNSIPCNECKRPVHLKYANMKNSFFTCRHCESDYED